MSEHRSGPLRTCVGCRSVGEQAALLRVVGVEPSAGSGDGSWRLLPDPGRRVPGRGAYVHRDLGCVQLAERRRAFGRALRRSGAPDVSAVQAHLDAQT